MVKWPSSSSDTAPVNRSAYAQDRILPAGRPVQVEEVSPAGTTAPPFPCARNPLSFSGAPVATDGPRRFRPVFKRFFRGAGADMGTRRPDPSRRACPFCLFPAPESLKRPDLGGQVRMSGSAALAGTYRIRTSGRATGSSVTIGGPAASSNVRAQGPCGSRGGYSCQCLGSDSVWAHVTRPFVRSKMPGRSSCTIHASACSGEIGWGAA